MVSGEENKLMGFGVASGPPLKEFPMARSEDSLWVDKINEELKIGLRHLFDLKRFIVQL